MACHSVTKVIPVFALVLALCACVTTAQKDPDESKGQAPMQAVRLTQTQRGAMITSDERILFDTGKSIVKSDGQIFLDRVAELLKTKTKANVIIEGHTDNVGPDAQNQQLSQERAVAVMRGLVARGTAAARIQTKGFGMSNPIAENSTEEGRQSNRRTEIIILGESVEKLGGASLADKLSAGLDRFLRGVTGVFKKITGSKQD
jgi:outer membrane protein OmpA-like peptidoglycan-associated protein